MIVIGCDPGRSFGIAVLVIQPEPFTITSTPWQSSASDSLQYLEWVLKSQASIDPESFVTLGRVAPKTVVVTERFVLMPGSSRKSHITETPSLVGHVTQLVAQYPNVEYAEQSVSDASRGFSNTTLKRLGLYVTPSQVQASDANDANSAVRHCLLWLSLHRADLFDTLIKRSQLL